MNVICNISISLGEFCCCRQHLGSFGIGGDLALQPMYTLSGGQKSRVAFAKVTFSKPHILLLDEPSNHLDLDAVNALIQVCFIRLCNKVFITFFERFVTKFPWMCLTAFGCQQRCCQSSNQHIRTLAAQDQFWKGEQPWHRFHVPACASLGSDMLTTMYSCTHVGFCVCASTIMLFITCSLMYLRRLGLLCRVWRLSKEAFSWSAMTSI